MELKAKISKIAGAVEDLTSKGPQEEERKEEDVMVHVAMKNKDNGI